MAVGRTAHAFLAKVFPVVRISLMLGTSRVAGVAGRYMLMVASFSFLVIFAIILFRRLLVADRNLFSKLTLACRTSPSLSDSLSEAQQ